MKDKVLFSWDNGRLFDILMGAHMGLLLGMLIFFIVAERMMIQ